MTVCLSGRRAQGRGNRQAIGRQARGTREQKGGGWGLGLGRGAFFTFMLYPFSLKKSSNPTRTSTCYRT
jgi:hypothetical protein